MAHTHVFKLTSGVECEVREMTGKHQRILTEQKNKKIGENLNEVIEDVLVRVGSVTTIDSKFVENLLASDRKKILTECRQFTMDFDPEFKFTYDYIAKDKSKQKFELAIDLKDGFPSRNLMVEQEGELVEASYSEYSEINKKVTLVLPKSGKQIQWTILDGLGEMTGAATSKAERSSHTALKMRNPVELVKTDAGFTPIQINLDTLSFKDIEAIRSSIKKIEGNVDTEIQFEHPEAELKPASEKMVTVDVLSVLAFFFPSEAI